MASSLQCRKMNTHDMAKTGNANHITTSAWKSVRVAFFAMDDSCSAIDVAKIAHHELNALESGENAIVRTASSSCVYVATRVPIPSMSGCAGRTPFGQIIVEFVLAIVVVAAEAVHRHPRVVLQAVEQSARRRSPATWS